MAVFFLLILLVCSVVAEGITNSKPLVARTRGGKWIVPAYIHYNRPDVGLEGAGTIDYKDIKDQFPFAIWPLLPWDPYENDGEQDEFMLGPNLSHFMGTDVAGRDVFARLLYGTRMSFLFAFCVWVLTFFIGTCLGLFQGFMGGKVDLWGQRLTEIFASTPEFYLLLFLISLFTPHLGILIPLASLFGWITIARYMRAEALQNRKKVYCEASQALGATPLHILWRHVLPNSLVPIITLSPFALVGGITALAQLDFLGFGVPAPTPSWGELLDQAQRNFQIAWWLAVFPGAFLFATVVSLNLVGEALRDVFEI